MIFQSACRAQRSQTTRRSARDSARVLATENLTRPHCPRCGTMLLVAEESRFSPNGRIDHDWFCDNCGNAFGTSIRLAAASENACKVA